MTWHSRLTDNTRLLWLLAASLAYLLLSTYQLGLPGLHYDEAKEAGVNAMELISGTPVTAFRGATVDLFGVQLPLMVQDYIGALNVYLVAPFLAATGVGVPNLRIEPVLIGLATLFLLERAVSEWIACCDRLEPATRASISTAGVFAVMLTAVSPSFIFWSRQGIFVTNLMQPLCLLAVWQGVRWMRTGRSGALLMAAFSAGLALYAKLLAVWIVAPFVLLVAVWWIRGRVRDRDSVPRITPALFFGSMLAFLLPLGPVALFNVKTGGTMSTLVGSAGRSYYGVDNLDVFANLATRAAQVVQILRGDQFWYLGGSYASAAAPWLALVSVVAGLWRAPRCVIPPVLLVAAAVLASVFTISDLFVTHYALLFPFVIGTAAIALDRVWTSHDSARRRSGAVRTAVGLLVVLWFAGNLAASVNYHRALARSGGLGDHSDATYHLAYYLRYQGLGAPIMLDWGADAPVHFLSQGTVRPIEIFGYDSLTEPDEGFDARLAQFLPNPDNVYVLHAPGYAVFDGRREAFLSATQERGLSPQLVESFGQRDGQVLYEIWRAENDVQELPE